MAHILMGVKRVPILKSGKIAITLKDDDELISVKKTTGEDQVLMCSSNGRMARFNEDEIILCSAKNGIGIKELVEAVIERVPAPTGKKEDNLQALIFDSYFDAYRGIVTLIRVVNGSVKVGDKIKMFATDTVYDVVEVGVNTPHIKKKNMLTTGEVGYLCASIKKIQDVKVGLPLISSTCPQTVRI